MRNGKPTDTPDLRLPVPAEPPGCWYCGSRAAGPTATLILTSLPFRRNGALDAPRPGRRVHAFYCCEACVERFQAARDFRAYWLPLRLIFAEVAYEAEVARLRTRPWWSAEVEVALAQAHAAARVEERDDGPAIEAAVAESRRERA